MRDNHTRSGQNFLVSEDGFDFGVTFWDDTVGNRGEALSYSDPGSPWSSFAPDTPPGIGIVAFDMPSTPQGSSFGISGDHPEENELHGFSVHHNSESLTMNPSHLDIGQYPAMYDTGVQASGSYINTQAFPYPPFSGLGPSGPPPITQTLSQYPFEQPVEAYQTSDTPSYSQYSSEAVEGAHPAPYYTSST